MIDITHALPLFRGSSTADDTGPTSTVTAEEGPVVQSWVGDLVVTYAVELDGALAYVRWRDILRLGIDADELRARAVANLQSRIATHLRFAARGAIVGLFLDGLFDASTLLVDDVWSSGPPAELEPPLVAVAAARDIVAITSGRSAEGIAELRAIVDSVLPIGERALSRHLLVRRDDGWATY